VSALVTPHARLQRGGLNDQVFSRTVGAHLIPGNDVRLLRDARENYPSVARRDRSREAFRALRELHRA
jgi:hypothetical protein